MEVPVQGVAKEAIGYVTTHSRSCLIPFLLFLVPLWSGRHQGLIFS